MKLYWLPAMQVMYKIVLVVDELGISYFCYEKKIYSHLFPRTCQQKSCLQKTAINYWSTTIIFENLVKTMDICFAFYVK
jgi:hypothetical protein